MRVRVIRLHRSSLVTQVVPAPPLDVTGVLLQARLGHQANTPARDVADGLRAKQRVALLLDDGSRWISGAVRSYDYKVREYDGVRSAGWDVTTEHGAYRLEVLEESDATPVRVR